MERQRVQDTKPELALRRHLHGLGLRYRLHVRAAPDIRSKPDIVFKQAKVAVYVDGCFWHGCPQHFVQPKNNADWWATKIAANRERDRRTRESLRDLGWLVVPIWEHEDMAQAASEVAVRVQGRQSSVSHRRPQ